MPCFPQLWGKVLNTQANDEIVSSVKNARPQNTFFQCSLILTNGAQIILYLLCSRRCQKQSHLQSILGQVSLCYHAKKNLSIYYHHQVGKSKKYNFLWATSFEMVKKTLKTSYTNWTQPFCLYEILTISLCGLTLLEPPTSFAIYEYGNVGLMPKSTIVCSMLPFSFVIFWDDHISVSDSHEWKDDYEFIEFHNFPCTPSILNFIQVIHSHVL